jgi:Asp/Glu/hydantoin racemase
MTEASTVPPPLSLAKVTEVEPKQVLRIIAEAEPVVVALVSGCDGMTALRDRLDVLAAAPEVDPAAVLADVAVRSSRTWSSAVS